MPPKPAGLSGNTLSLKFMSRGTKPSSTLPQSVPQTVPTASKLPRPPAEEDPEWTLPGVAASIYKTEDDALPSSVASVEVVRSYLPFLLGDREEVGDSGKGGRRSFGGANKVVEKLSAPPTEPSLDVSEEAAPISTSTPVPSTATATVSAGSSSKAFRRPAGFDEHPSGPTQPKPSKTDILMAGARASASEKKEQRKKRKSEALQEDVKPSIAGDDEDEDEKFMRRLLKEEGGLDFDDIGLGKGGGGGSGGGKKKRKGGR